MNESDDKPSERDRKHVPSSPVAVLDWRVLAEDRLQRLVEIEHDHAVIRDRLELLQVDYREILVANAEQLHRIRGLDREHERLLRMLADLENSHSWRLTRPLRTVSSWSGFRGRQIGRLVRALLRIRVLRRAARLLVRWIPGLEERLHRKLHVMSGMPERGNLP